MGSGGACVNEKLGGWSDTLDRNFTGCGVGRFEVHARRVVRWPGQAELESAEFRVRPRVVDFIYPHGGGVVAGLATRRLFGSTYSLGVVRIPAGSQRAVVVSLFWSSTAGLRVRMYCRPVARNSRDDDRVLAAFGPGELVTISVLGLGELRERSKPAAVAVERVTRIVR